MKPKIGGKHFQFQIPFDSVSFLRLPLIFLAHELYMCVPCYTQSHIHTHTRSYTQFLALAHLYLLIFAALVQLPFSIKQHFLRHIFSTDQRATFIRDMKNTHLHIHIAVVSLCDVNYWKSTKQIKIFIFMMIIIIIIMNLVDSKISVCHEAFELMIVMVCE